ncbi:MAG: anti-sigma factor domain-containing protein [Kyrpidia sp.]|nr:anti-sigma factor domain-containing protein [Kyrpidia sp.]
MKGIVVKTDGKQAIVLTRDRRFVRVPCGAGLVVGQETELPRALIPQQGVGVRLRALRTLGWGVAAVVVLAAGVGWRVLGPSLVKPPAYAYVTVDADSAVEFAVDETNRVTDLNVLNGSEDSADQAGLRGLPVSEAVAAWVHRAVAQHRLQDGGEVFIATAPGAAGAAALDGLNRQVAYAVANAVKNDVDLLHVDALQVPEEVRKKALAEGMSPGRYYLYTVARDRGVAVNIEEFRRQSIAALLSSHRELVGLLQQIQVGRGNGWF